MRADQVLVGAELAVLRARLRTVTRNGTDPEAGAGDPGLAGAEAALAEARREHPDRTALDALVEAFALSAFERAVLLLAAGPELVAATRDDLVAACGQPRPSFGLCLSVLPDPHWSALTPVAPLRRWGLVELLEPGSPAHSPLMVEERVLHHLVGAGHLDVTVAAVARPVATPAWLPRPLASVAEDVARRWRHRRPVLVHGPQRANLRGVAAAAADLAGLRLYVLRAADVPGEPAARDRLLRRLERETALTGCAWAVDVDGLSSTEGTGLVWSLAGLDAPVVLLGDDTLDVGADVWAVAVPRLALADRRELLGVALRDEGQVAPEADLDAAAGVFDPDLDAARDLASEVAGGRPLWEACRRAGRAGFGGLARVVTPRAGWDELVLPEPQHAQLLALAAVLRHRRTVLDQWGFGARRRGIGTTALFAGPSGTGKTLAGEVVAGAVDLDLVHVDLSQVVSKYIGETEKNLGRLFDAAEDAGAVLLFDEADTLFGRRSEVRDSHDRYANLEVGYLLQRMEDFRGLAILTTNDRSALDPAFLRRLQFIVSFPYPTPATREALWRVALPAEAPREDVEPAALASFDLAGGGIAAVALTAAYLAAEDGRSLGSEHVDRAVRWELGKSGRVAWGAAGRPRA